LFKEFSNLKAKRVGSFLSLNIILSTTLALFIFGMCGLLIIQANRLGVLIKENAELQVFLEHDLPKNQLEDLKKLLLQQNFILKANGSSESSLKFISKEEAAKEFVEDTKENFQELLGFNPLRDAFVVKIRPEFFGSKKLANIRANLESKKGIYEVSYVEDLMTLINKNINMIGFILLLFGFFILLTVVVLVDNTLRIALFSQRMLIRSMQLVGATDTFIQKPFLIQALIQGSLSGLIASILLSAFLKYIQIQIPDLILLYESEKLFLLLFSLVIMGGVTSLLSTYRAVRKYLSMSLDDLY
jgi:cell division transport system permease protein